MEEAVNDHDRSRQPQADAGPHTAHQADQAHDAHRPEDELESYAGGEILVRHGKVNRWLLFVYLALGIWAMYYLFTYWGGLGPGLAY
jgi:hypothetical protein